MRPFLRLPISTALVAMSLAILAFSSPFSFGQEPVDGKRKLVSKVDPVYPELAARTQMAGRVKVQAIVAPNGKVKFTQVIGGNPLLAKYAVDAIEKWKWGPAQQETKELIELDFHP